jgi:hypothetical protein
MDFNVNTNSLDQYIATFQKADYQNIKALVIHNGEETTVTNCKTFK